MTQHLTKPALTNIDTIHLDTTKFEITKLDLINAIFIKPKHINQDYAQQDKRSISAMLRGSGDKREQDFLKYAKAHPELDELALIENYSLHVLGKQSRTWLKTQAAKQGLGCLLLLELAEILLIMQIPSLRDYLPF